MSSPPLLIPPGWGFDPVPKRDWYSPHADEDSLAPLLGKLLLWEPPNHRSRYVISADVAEGVQQDRSSVDVLRVGDLTSPDEQVAHFISDDIDPFDLAHVIDALGRFYKDAEGLEALVAIETNGPGYSVQGEMQRHLGYSHFWVWQHEDTRPDRNRYSGKIGWYTNVWSRRAAVGTLLKSLKTIRSPDPWILINSPFTIREFQDFQVEAGEPTHTAAAAPGAHDDCLLSLAIGLYCVKTLHSEAGETLADRRGRLAEERRRHEDYVAGGGDARDFHNTPVTVDQMKSGDTTEDGASWSSGSGDYVEYDW